MTGAQAAYILEQHNWWRRGGEGEMVTPALLGKAIDFAIEALRAGDQAKKAEDPAPKAERTEHSRG